MTVLPCLECEAELSISDMAEAGDLVTCHECDAVFEIVAVDPVEIDFADENDGIDKPLLVAEEIDGASALTALDAATGSVSDEAWEDAEWETDESKPKEGDDAEEEEGDEWEEDEEEGDDDWDDDDWDDDDDSWDDDDDDWDDDDWEEDDDWDDDDD